MARSSFWLAATALLLLARPAWAVTIPTGQVCEYPELAVGHVATTGPHLICRVRTEPEGAAISYAIVSDPSGRFFIDTDFLSTYDNFNYEEGPTEFVVGVSASDGVETATGFITIRITDVNDYPVVCGDSATAPHGGAVAINVLANDVDEDGDSLAPVIHSAPAYGTAIPNADGTITYQHDGSSTTADSFTYRAFDGADHSEPATVAISIEDISAPPVAHDASHTLEEDGELLVSLLADSSNGDVLLYQVTTHPQNGSLLGQSSPDSFKYKPYPNFYGEDSFTFHVWDGTAWSNTATVTLTVIPVNDKPQPQAQSVRAVRDNPVAVTLTASDVDGDTLTYAISDYPANGTLTGTPPNLTYLADPGFTGTDTFTFYADDSQPGGNYLATVTVYVRDYASFSHGTGPLTLRTEGTEYYPANSADFFITNGTGDFTVSVTGPAEATIEELGSPGSYRFIAPCNGTFAGTYTIMVDDGVSPTIHTTVYVPMKLSAPPFTILGVSTTRSVMVTGAGLGDEILWRVFDSEGNEDTGAALLTDSGTTSTVYLYVSTSHRADFEVVTVDPDFVGTFSLRAENLTNPELLPVEAGPLPVVPIATYSATVLDRLGDPVYPGGKVYVEGVATLYWSIMPDGIFRFQCPRPEGTYHTLRIEAEGHPTATVDGELHQDGMGSIIRLMEPQGRIDGTISGPAAGSTVRLAAYSAGAVAASATVTATGGETAFALDFADRPTVDLLEIRADGCHTLLDATVYDLSERDLSGIALTLERITVIPALGTDPADPNSDAVLDPTGLEGGFSVAAASADPAEDGDRVEVSVPPGGIDLGGNAVTGATLRIRTYYIGDGTPLYLIDLDALDQASEPLPTSGEGNIIRELHLTIPLAAPAPLPSELESGTRQIVHAATVEDYLAGDFTPVPSGDILGVSYDPPAVTFKVDHLSVFALLPLPGQPGGPEPGGTGSSSSSGGCFLNLLTRQSP